MMQTDESLASGKWITASGVGMTLKDADFPSLFY